VPYTVPHTSAHMGTTHCTQDAMAAEEQLLNESAGSLRRKVTPVED